MNIQNKNVLITGANGLVGIPTVEKCLALGAKTVHALDLNLSNLLTLKEKNSNLFLKSIDLTYLDKVEDYFKEHKIDIVMHLAGIKGNPNRAKLCPADYFYPMVMFNTNVFKAAFDTKVEWLVYLSSVGVYAPADVMEENSVWETMPSKNDWYPGWAKRCGELALETLKQQYNWANYTIIRPANIFGENDNFSPDATVIASNTYKLFHSENSEIECWGDGRAKRDFVFAKDVAEAVITVTVNEIHDIVNFGSGKAISIKETIELLVAAYEKLYNKNILVKWDTSKPNGDLLRCLGSDKQKKYNLIPKTSIEEALRLTLLGYHNKIINAKFNVIK